MLDSNGPNYLLICFNENVFDATVFRIGCLFNDRLICCRNFSYAYYCQVTSSFFTCCVLAELCDSVVNRFFSWSHLISKEN